VVNSGVLTVGLSPAIQKTLVFSGFEYGGVNRSEFYLTDAAGKSINVCRVLNQTGVRAAALVPLGKENADYFERLCARDNLRLTAVTFPGRVRTCVTMVDKNQGIATELVVNEPEEFPAAKEEELRQAYLELLTQGYRAVVISGSKPKGFSDEILPFLVRSAKQAGVMVVADFIGADLKNACYSPEIRPDVIKINDVELARSFPSRGTLVQTIKGLAADFQNLVVISRGSASTLAANTQGLMEFPSRVVPAVNAIGCGDSMTAGITHGLLEGLVAEEAIERGISYAALNAQSLHPGWILDDAAGERLNHPKPETIR
jgi:1-phosphofructokinase family hexose kinase